MPISNAFKFANNIISNGKFDANDLSVPVTGGPSLQAVKTSGFTAVANEAYPCNTTSSAFTVTLPATPSAGDEIIILDYAGTFDTNALTISPNGNKIEGLTGNQTLNGDREGVRLVYIDSTQGWLAYSGINEGTDALSPAPYSVDFLVIAGGGGGGSSSTSDPAGGGGAGGYRNSFSTETSGGGGSSESSLSFNLGTVYTVTVGSGGNNGGSTSTQAGAGNNSSISGTGITTITSTGGGFGGNGSGNGSANATRNGGTGGSGGGAGYSTNPGPGSGTAGTGTANQGFNGALYGGGGGGGAAVTNTGGIGLASSITGSLVTRGVGGTSLANTGAGANGTVNTGNGAQSGFNGNGGNGGSGVVILRMPDANYSGTFTGSPTVITGVGGTDTVIIFEESGSITG
jgi:hypothetical protein